MRAKPRALLVIKYFDKSKCYGNISRKTKESSLSVLSIILPFLNFLTVLKNLEFISLLLTPQTYSKKSSMYSMLEYHLQDPPPHDTEDFTLHSGAREVAELTRRCRSINRPGLGQPITFSERRKRNCKPDMIFIYRVCVNSQYRL